MDVQPTLSDEEWALVIELIQRELSELPTEIFMTGFQPAAGSRVALLGAEGELRWRPIGTGFAVEIPDQLQTDPPCDNAWVIKVSPTDSTDAPDSGEDP